jgi:hypothetical protein
MAETLQVEALVICLVPSLSNNLIASRVLAEEPRNWK